MKIKIITGDSVLLFGAVANAALITYPCSGSLYQVVGVGHG